MLPANSLFTGFSSQIMAEKASTVLNLVQDYLSANLSACLNYELCI